MEANPTTRRRLHDRRRRAIGAAWFRTTLALWLLVAGAGGAWAQTSTGGVRGFVKDDTGAVLVGVTVEASSPARIGGAAVEITDAQGLYTFENLPPGDYTVAYSLQGFGTVRREAIRVEVGRTMQLDIQLQVGNVEQSITVSGDSPVVDALHAGLTSNFNNELLANVPSIRLAYFDVITYAPSVKLNQVSNCVKFIVFGSSSDQNAYQYDGIEISATTNGGVWDYPSPEMIQEVQVKAVGASAEYSGFQGGVINIVTKSGSNTLRGTGTFFITPTRLVGNNTPNEQFPYTLGYDQQATIEMGGPIARDRLWFYGMLPYARFMDYNPGVDPSIRRVAGQGVQAVRQGHVEESARTTTSRRCSRATCGAFRPTPAAPTRFSRRPPSTCRRRRPWRAGTASSATRRRSSSRGAASISATTSRRSATISSPRGAPISAPGSRPPTRTPASQFRQNRTTVDASLAHSASDFLKGSHDFKFGVQTMLATTQTNTLIMGGAYFTDLNTAPYLAVFRDPAVTGARFRTFGTFVQDNWTVNERLTLNLGVRYDRILGDIPSMPSQVTLEGLASGVTALSSATNIDYPAIEDVFGFNHIDPRVGFTLRLDQSGKTVFKTHYGRYHGKVTGGMIAALSPGSTPIDARRWNPATSRYNIPVTVVDPKQNYAVDPDLRNQFTGSGLRRPRTATDRRHGPQPHVRLQEAARSAAAEGRRAARMRRSRW